MGNRRKIVFDDFGSMEVEEDTGKLYWDGEPVVTEQEIRLQPWVNGAVAVGGFSTGLLALIEIVRLVAPLF